MLPDKRLLYLTSRELIAFLWKGGKLQKEAAFAPGDEGAAAFSEYASRAADSLFYLLADLVEEDFFQENIPYLRGGDRHALLARKLAQRYRDTSLAIALSLGNEVVGRREERILYASFTNTQQFQPWLGALRAVRARIAGVYSIPLVTPLLCRRLGFKSRRYMMVSLQQAGLRQTYIENDRVRFSRVGKVEPGDTAALAEACANESARFYQYLQNSRILSRETIALDVIVLAPSDARPLFEAACANTAQLRFHIVDLDSAHRSAGLKSVPPGGLAETLYLHVTARARFVSQFADDALRRFYDLWRTQVGLLASGLTLFAACLLVSGVKLLQAEKVERVAAGDRVQQAAAAEQYAKMQASFPKTPVPADILKTTVRNFQTLMRQDARVRDTLVEISHALASVPQIDVEKIDWEIAALKRAGTRDAAKAQPAPATVSGTGATVEPRFQVVEISGRLLLQHASDYRNISMVVNQFVEALRGRPGIEVISTKLPFDLAAEKSISGDIGAARSVEVPRFSVVISRRLET
jgi:hypothetical protein